MSKTIFITGASKGFGRLWAEAFLKRGDKVIATSRNADSLKKLSEMYGDRFLAFELEITNRSEVFKVMEMANDHFPGGIDVLINNAGFGVIGTVEEYSEKEARDQFDVNFFGTLWTTQAILPIFREKGKGHIVQMSSVLGINTVPTCGIYSASKYAVEGLSEALQQEVKDFGIHVTLIEPTTYSTEFGSSAQYSVSNPAYDQVKAALAANPAFSEAASGIPTATIEALFAVVDSSHPPLHFFLGNAALGWTQYNYSAKLAEWEEWKDISAKAQGK